DGADHLFIASSIERSPLFAEVYLRRDSKHHLVPSRIVHVRVEVRTMRSRRKALIMNAPLWSLACSLSRFCNCNGTRTRRAPLRYVMTWRRIKDVWFGSL